MKISISRLSLFVFILMLGACSDSNYPGLEIAENMSGTLIWGGQPAADGTGLIFRTGDITYGISGDRSDYSTLFIDDSNSAEIRTDLAITGKETVRGWGVTYPIAILIKPERL